MEGENSEIGGYVYLENIAAGVDEGGDVLHLLERHRARVHAGAGGRLYAVGRRAQDLSVLELCAHFVDRERGGLGEVGKPLYGLRRSPRVELQTQLGCQLCVHAEAAAARLDKRHEGGRGNRWNG